MGRIKEYIYRRLPVGKGEFYDKAYELKCILEDCSNQLRDSFHHRREIVDQLNGRIDYLTGKVERLERIVTHYHQQDMKMFWQEYRRENETTEEAQKRFFRSLPTAKGIERNLQLLEAELIRAFAAICDENGLPYWLYAGTLLGAVRHKGFIPWDDDVDTGMLRSDIDKLQSVLEGYPEYRLTVRYDPWGYCKQIRFCFADTELPVFLDVFPFDWCTSASRQTWEENQLVKRRLREELSDESNPLIQQFRQAGCIDVDSALGKEVEIIFRKYEEQLWADGVFCEESQAEALLFSFDSWNPCDDSNIVGRELFFPLQKMEFEGILCSVPNQYAFILSELYGDIYTFPCGEPHFLHADWKKNKKKLAEEVEKRVKKI